MTPYYQEDGITIYHGDCRVILPALDTHGDTCIVDPVWPNSVFPMILDPQQLFSEAVTLLHIKRLVVHLGCLSDPRFLAAVPLKFPFLRVCWLRYAHPSYVGRALMGSDVAYLYGEPPPSRPGLRLMPGEWVARNNQTKAWHTGRGHGSSTDVPYTTLPHPTARRLEHVMWLVERFSEQAVIDPFCGTGTTLLAAKELNRDAIGIDIEEGFCEIAANRLRQGVFAFEEMTP